MSIRNSKVMVFAACMLFAGQLWATSAAFVGEITKTLTVASDKFGGCMVLMDAPLANSGLNCQGKWVTFSCVGEFTSKERAQRLFESAQLAFALGMRVRLQVTDNKKHNGWCFADRVDVIR